MTAGAPENKPAVPPGLPASDAVLTEITVQSGATVPMAGVSEVSAVSGEAGAAIPAAAVPAASPASGSTPSDITTAATATPAQLAGQVAPASIPVQSRSPAGTATSQAQSVELSETDGGDDQANATQSAAGKSAVTAGAASGVQPTNTAATTNGAADDVAKNAAVAMKDLPVLQDGPPRSHDMSRQSGTSAASQTSAVPSAFGSELRLVSDASHTAQTAAARTAPNFVAGQVAVQINRAVHEGQDKLVVHLKPAALGNVSIHLEVGHDKRIIAVIAAERPETLDLLQRDSRALELALKDAGLKADSGSLSFSLQGNGEEEAPFDDMPGSKHSIALPADGDEIEALPAGTPLAYAVGGTGIDLHI